MKILRIKETCIYVTNLDQTRNFYNHQLGLDVISEVPGRHIFFRAGDSVLLCFIASSTDQEKNLPPHGAKGSIHFAFEVEKEEYILIKKKIENSGITILHEQEWKQKIKSFYFHDPDNNLLEIIEEGLWEV